MIFKYNFQSCHDITSLNFELEYSHLFMFASSPSARVENSKVLNIFLVLDNLNIFIFSLVH